MKEIEVEVLLIYYSFGYAIAMVGEVGGEDSCQVQTATLFGIDADNLIAYGIGKGGDDFE